MVTTQGRPHEKVIEAEETFFFAVHTAEKTQFLVILR